MNPKKLSEETWRSCVDSMPIFGIDMIIYSKIFGILMGKRENDPAKGKLFVPGGRVYKNEKRVDAFNRILLSETGLKFNFEDTKSMGLYEHFYTTNKWHCKDIQTHYIIEARLIELKSNNEDLKINLDDQHSYINWINLYNISQTDIHEYSKLYLDKAKEILS